MNSGPLFDALIACSERAGRPLAESIRHHLLEGVLRRLGSTPDLVLRGSMATRSWAAPFPRRAQDLDFLGTFPGSVEQTAARLLPALAAERDDGVRFEVARCRARGIWESSAFPGVRLTLFAQVLGEAHVTTVDVGFGDPLVPPAVPALYPFCTGEPQELYVVHPATLAAWKLHGLAEWSQARWRPKDLLDLWLLCALAPADPELQARALAAAFESRGYPAQAARQTLERGPATPEEGGEPFWESSVAQARWDRFREEQEGLPIPESVLSVRDEVAALLGPALNLLS
jgi:hypothetical protein